MSYTKLFSSILTSTIWDQDATICKLWITLLALANKYGVVEGSIPGLAHQARISLEDCKRGLETLLAPDPYSRTTDHDGCRIQVVDGGWQILNYGKYRYRMSADEQREKARIRKQRQREREAEEIGVTPDVTPMRDMSRLSLQAEAEAEAEEQESISSEPSVYDSSPSSEVTRDEKAARWVFDYYVKTLGRNPKTYIYTDRRRRLLLRVLKTAIQTRGDREKAANFLANCIDALTESDFHMGRDPKTGGRSYKELENVFGPDKFQKWATIVEEGEQDESDSNEAAAFLSSHPEAGGVL